MVMQLSRSVAFVSAVAARVNASVLGFVRVNVSQWTRATRHGDEDREPGRRTDYRWRLQAGPFERGAPSSAKLRQHAQTVWHTCYQRARKVGLTEIAACATRVGRLVIAPTTLDASGVASSYAFFVTSRASPRQQ